MSLFSICNDCWICSLFDGHCYVGNGDDNYYPASKEQVLDRLSKYKGHFNERERQQMVNFLRDKYGVDWSENI